MSDLVKRVLYPTATAAVLAVSTAMAAAPYDRPIDDILGTEVLDVAGRSLGVVREVLIDTAEHDVTYVLAPADAPLEDRRRAVRVHAAELEPLYRDDGMALLLPPGAMSRLQTFELPVNGH